MNVTYMKDYRNATMLKIVLFAGVIGAIGLAFVSKSPEPRREPLRAIAPFTTVEKAHSQLPTPDLSTPSYQLLQEVYQRQAALTQWGASLTIQVMDENEITSKQGKVAVMQDQYRLETEEEKVISNGETLWVYTRKDGQLQISEATPDANNFFCYPTQLMQRYQQFCEVEEIPSTDKNSRIIAFTATDKRAPFAQMEVTIDPEQYRIQKITVRETSTIGYSITINTLYPDAVFNPTLFTFDERLVEQSRIKDFR